MSFVMYFLAHVIYKDDSFRNIFFLLFLEHRLVDVSIAFEEFLGSQLLLK